MSINVRLRVSFQRHGTFADIFSDTVHALGASRGLSLLFAIEFAQSME